jgi:hypothetical protein
VARTGVFIQAAREAGLLSGTTVGFDKPEWTLPELW